MGGREVSRPYRVWFFAEGERFYPFGDATDLVRGRQSTGIAKRLFVMFLFQFPSIYPLNLCFNRNRQIFNILRQKPQEDAL